MPLHCIRVLSERYRLFEFEQIDPIVQWIISLQNVIAFSRATVKAADSRPALSLYITAIALPRIDVHWLIS